MTTFPRVEGAVDPRRLSIRTAPTHGRKASCAWGVSPCIFYDNVPLWRTGAPLSAVDVFLYDPQGRDEPYTLFCVDCYNDVYTYGQWRTLDEALAWLTNPKMLY